MGSIVAPASYAIGCCFGFVAVGSAAVGTYCLVQAVKVHDVYNQCCGENNQYNSHSPCPGGGLKERAQFCDQKKHDTDSDIKIGAILLASAVALCCFTAICCVLSSKIKRQGYRTLS